MLFRSSLLREIILQASALFAEAFSEREFIVKGDSVKINTFLINRSCINIKLQSIGVRYANMDTLYHDHLLLYNQSYKHSFSIIAPEPDASDPLSVTYNILIENTPFSIRRQVQYKYTDPVKGEIYWPIVYYPAVTIEPMQKLFLIKENDDTVKVSFKIKNY